MTVGLPVSDLGRAARLRLPRAGAVDYFDFADLDGNRLSLYSLLDD